MLQFYLHMNKASTKCAVWSAN